MVKLVTVATHSESYFPWLKESCVRYNTNLEILGWGEKWQGYHRGWKVLDYDRDIVPEPGWGTNPNGGSNRIKVCYRGGVLGVAIVRYVGTGLMNTLATTNSMYKTKK